MYICSDSRCGNISSQIRFILDWLPHHVAVVAGGQKTNYLYLLFTKKWIPPEDGDKIRSLKRSVLSKGKNKG
jgi:hypothetical protein